MKGYLPHSAAKAVVFWIVIGCLLAAIIAGLCIVWNDSGEGQELARRWIWSAFILASGSIVFLCANVLFGNLEYHVFDAKGRSPDIDPAFAERLKRAKDFREEHSGTEKTG